MKKTILATIVIGLAVLMPVSCDMDLVPYDGIAYKEGTPLFQKATDVTSFENGILSSFRACQYGRYSITSEVQCDGFNAMSGFGNNYGSPHRNDDTFTSSDYDVEAMWSNNYTAIKNYNIAIAQADLTSGKLRESARILKGEAFFFRAASYLTLVRHFAKPFSSANSGTPGVPLVLVYDQNERPARATVGEVYDQIGKDLDSAAVILVGVAGKVRADRPTIDAVNFVKARYLLDRQEYASAISSADAVINSKAGYALADTEERMKEEYRNDKGTEPILQFFANSTTEAPRTNGSYTRMSSNDEQGLFFAPLFLPSQKLISTYDPDDIRLTVWFSKNEYPVFVNGQYVKDVASVFVKYFGNEKLRSGNVPDARQAVKPFMLAEMYLIKAEAASQSNQTAAATAALNELQGKRGAQLTSGSMDDIKEEWFKETVGEGLRLICLKRWGDGFSVRTPQPEALGRNMLQTGASYEQLSLQASDYHFVWPIPSHDMNINKSLVQNEGYASE